ncbi:MAG: adenylate/guanylate cyclase domain-containing protein [Actinomycetota bacterium]
MFTDVVGSTEMLSRMGDRKWRDTLDKHDSIVRSQLDRHSGRLIDTAGDGVLSTFDGPGRAIRCASDLHRFLGSDGIPIRVGIHTGEVELRPGGDVGGIAVHIGARIAARATAGETLVSGTVRDLVAGSVFQFEDRGIHELKGIPDRWRIYKAI